jgi:hypothetical protein
MCDKNIEFEIIDINIVFYNNLMDIIQNLLNKINCDFSNLKNNIKYANILLNEKSKLELELQQKLDDINKTNTTPQTTGNLVVSDKLKILIKNKNICDIVLFLMGRTSFIRGYCSALLITKINKKYYKLLNKTITTATNLENDLFNLHECLCVK